MADCSSAADCLGPDGPIARRLGGFTARASQQAMAAAIESAIADNRQLVAESGTGTGKTFAYLVPALRAGRKVLVSTGTKALQDQLFNRDLALVREALSLPVSVALLKGRANYLCLHRLARTVQEGLREPTLAQELMRVDRWRHETASGDIAEASGVAEDSMLWPRVTSTADNCLGAECPEYNDCFVNKARREAQATDLLVVNHHLFFADLALREDGFGRLLPGVEVVIFDEAHQLPEIATDFFGYAVSSAQLIGLARDTLAEDIKEKSAVAGLREAGAALEKASADFRLSLSPAGSRAPWSALAGKPAVAEAHGQLAAALDELSGKLTQAAARGPGLAACARRAAELAERLTLIHDSAPADYVAWVEVSARGFMLRLSPLSVADSFRTHLQDAERSWIFTSATLTVGGRFDHFLAALGLDAAETAHWDSPFDYEHQTLLYLPGGLPVPSAPQYTDLMLEKALPVLNASRGRAFLLFTSHRALKQAASWLEGRLPYPLLVQGDAPRGELLARFRALGNAVLLGTASFWEGVDVRGEALSCVIIDKLPFAAPDDPVLAARGAALEQAGENAFTALSLPAAVITLKQGVGRLIRDVSDRGVLMLADPRLTGKSYGRIFLDSLPPMPRTRDLAEVEAFFAGEAVDA